MALYAGHPVAAFTDLATEIATEGQLLRAGQAERATRAAERETCYRWVDPKRLARSFPGAADAGTDRHDRTTDPVPQRQGVPQLTGLVSKPSETGETDRKGQAPIVVRGQAAQPVGC